MNRTISTCIVFVFFLSISTVQAVVYDFDDGTLQGWTEIFMHPVPRGIPILPTADEVIAEINRSRQYLARCVKKIL